MVSKKEALILGGLIIGGVGLASMISDTDGEGIKERFGAILGTSKGIVDEAPATGILGGKEDVVDVKKVVSDPIYDITRDITEAPSRTAAQRDMPVIYGGYKPTGETFVFGGKGFETQAVKEIVSKGYSPTLGAAFGINRGGGGAAPTTGAAKKAVSHAKRLRAGRGD